MRRRADRIAHVVQRIEHGDEVEADARVVLGARRLEAHVAEALGVLPRLGDRGVVEVDADELRVREGLGHDQGRGAVAAADVGHLGAALELVHHAVERRQPLARARCAL